MTEPRRPSTAVTLRVVATSAGRRATITPVIALIVATWALAGDPLLPGSASQIVVAGLFVLALVVIGCRRSRAARASIDPFHPLVFPLLYVYVSFLAPMWLATVNHQPLRGLNSGIPIAGDTVDLLVIGVVGFAAGAAIRLHRKPPSRTGHRAAVSPTRLLLLGRGLLLVPIAISLQRYLTGVVGHRGVGHLIATPSKVLSTLLDPTEIAAVVVILAAHRMARHDRLLARLDWVLIGGLILLIGARGSRGNAIALLLVLMLVDVRRRTKLLAVVVGFFVTAVFGVVVLEYRAEAAGHQVSASPTDILLGDMTVAAFTTGATAAAVPQSVPYAHGKTLAAALVRQLPSPVANALFGPPNDTAALQFRQIVGFSNPNNGIGYSIPAEGYLNFGRGGVFVLCAALGLAFAWAYSRLDLVGGRTSGLIYPVLVAVLPFGLRSDSLGLIKSVLYAAILIQLLLIAARKPRRGARAEFARVDGHAPEVSAIGVAVAQP